MGKKSGPSAPNPARTAEAQAEANAESVRESARVNQVEQITPWGRVYYEDGPNPDDPLINRRQITELTPEAQAIFNQQQALTGYLTDLANQRAGQITTNPFTLEGMPAPPGTNDFEAARANAEQAAYARAVNLLNPDFSNQLRGLEQNISNRGLPFAGEAATRLRDDLSRRQNDARLAAAQDAVFAGAQEQSRLFGLAQAARQQAINDSLLQRTQPMNELAALIQGAPALQAPPSAAVPQYHVQAPDIAGLTQQAYATQQSAANNALNLTGGLFGNVLGGLLPF